MIVIMWPLSQLSTTFGPEYAVHPRLGTGFTPPSFIKAMRPLNGLSIFSPRLGAEEYVLNIKKRAPLVPSNTFKSMLVIF